MQPRRAVEIVQPANAAAVPDEPREAAHALLDGRTRIVNPHRQPEQRGSPLARPHGASNLRCDPRDTRDDALAVDG
jgi:hypothetical protein